MTSGPLPTLVASLKFARTSVATWTATLMPFSAPNSSAYFFRIGARSLSAQMTRSAAASRDGAPVVVVRPGYAWRTAHEEVLVARAVVQE
jgi:hypothetical protein